MQRYWLNLNFDESNNIVFINGKLLSSKNTLLHSPDEFALYEFDANALLPDQLKQFIKAIYKDLYKLAQIFINDDNSIEIVTKSVKNLSLDRLNQQGGYLFFEPEIDGGTSLTQFIDLIAHLRSPDGCPWDREQTLLTLRTNLLEEAHELLEAIDNNDIEGLKEELGDLLLQIVLQAQIASENGDFNLYSVISGIYKKIVFRHPHVFEKIEVDGVEGVLQNWEKWKAQERIIKRKT